MADSAKARGLLPEVLAGVLASLWELAPDGRLGDVTITQRRLAERSTRLDGKPRCERTARRHLAQLEALGWLLREHRTIRAGGGQLRQAANTYRLVLPAAADQLIPKGFERVAQPLRAHRTSDPVTPASSAPPTSRRRSPAGQSYAHHQDQQRLSAARSMARSLLVANGHDEAVDMVTAIYASHPDQLRAALDELGAVVQDRAGP